MDEKPLFSPRIIRNIFIELFIYGLLLVGYFLLVLEYLGEPLQKLFEENLTLYAFVALGLIVAQGVVLDTVVSFVIDLLGLDRLEGGH